MDHTVEWSEELPLETDRDIVIVRRRCRDAAREIGFRSTDQTRLMTAASELARNTVLHGGGGLAHVQRLARADGRAGLRLIVEDRGPGIHDIAQAMQDGFSSGRGLGLGLSGARRLSDDLQIESRPGELTRMVLTKWLR